MAADLNLGGWPFDDLLTVEAALHHCVDEHGDADQETVALWARVNAEIKNRMRLRIVREGDRN
jgi:hypothetical protein